MIRTIAKAIYESVEEATLYSNLDPTALDEIPKEYRGKNRDYQKFIVMSHHRSASSVIINTLQKHPNVFRFAEIFCPQYVQFRKAGYDDSSRHMYFLRKKYPIDFLERQVFTGYCDEIQAMGFKLFPEQLDFPHMAPVWDWIESHTDIKIIYLTRNDLLAYYTSLEIARKTGTWGVVAKKRASQNSQNRKEDLQIRLDYDTCVAVFERRKNLNKYALDRCKNHDILKVSYEDATSDLNRSLHQVQEFLNLAPQELDIHTAKQQQRPLPEVISNYQELKDRFSDTEWSYLFA